MKIFKLINGYALLTFVGSLGMLLYYVCNPNQYDKDVTDPIDRHRGRSFLLVSVFIKLGDQFVGKTGVFIILGAIVLISLRYLFKWKEL